MRERVSARSVNTPPIQIKENCRLFSLICLFKKYNLLNDLNSKVHVTFLAELFCFPLCKSFVVSSVNFKKEKIISLSQNDVQVTDSLY